MSKIRGAKIMTKSLPIMKIRPPQAVTTNMSKTMGGKDNNNNDNKSSTSCEKNMSKTRGAKIMTIIPPQTVKKT